MGKHCGLPLQYLISEYITSWECDGDYFFISSVAPYMVSSIVAISHNIWQKWICSISSFWTGIIIYSCVSQSLNINLDESNICKCDL